MIQRLNLYETATNLAGIAREHALNLEAKSARRPPADAMGRARDAHQRNINEADTCQHDAVRHARDVFGD